MVRRLLWSVVCWAVFPLNAWSALAIGDFTLGMPRQQVMAVLALSIEFNTTDVERVKSVVPLMRQAQRVPDAYGDRYEYFGEDGELVYHVSPAYGWTSVEIANPAISKMNRVTRAGWDQEARAKKP